VVLSASVCVRAAQFELPRPERTERDRPLWPSALLKRALLVAMPLFVQRGFARKIQAEPSHRGQIAGLAPKVRIAQLSTLTDSPARGPSPRRRSPASRARAMS